MSHVTTVKVEIKDLAALREACESIGLEFREGQKKYKWYGRFVGDYCFDDKTRIMTNSGFKKFKDLQEADKVLTLNPNNKNLEYQNFVPVIQDYKGIMYEFYGKAVNQTVTPNHRVFARRIEKRPGRTPTEYKFKTAEELSKLAMPIRYTVPRTGNWTGESPEEEIIPEDYFESDAPSGSDLVTIVRSRPKVKIPRRYKMSDWVEFMGWIIAEGCIDGNRSKNRKKDQHRVTIHQSDTANPENFKRIKELLTRMSFPFSIITKNGKKEGLGIYSKTLHTYLTDLGLNHKAKWKRIPDRFKNLSPKLLERMIESLLLGDGNEMRRLYTTSKKLRDDFIEICIKAGYGCTYSKKSNNLGFNFDPEKPDAKKHIWIVHISKRTINHQLSKLKKKNYSGKIYCVSTTNGIILIEKKGKISFSGNSEEGQDVKNMGKCDHAIAVPNNKNAYEIGVAWNAEKSCFELRYDFWQGGYGLEKVAGKKCGNLAKAYTQTVALKEAKKFAQENGWSVTHEYDTAADEMVIKLTSYD